MSLTAYFPKRNMKNCGGENEGGQKFLPSIKFCFSAVAFSPHSFSPHQSKARCGTSLFARLLCALTYPPSAMLKALQVGGAATFHQSRIFNKISSSLLV